MKTGTRLLSLFLACLMFFTSAPEVFAATFNVNSADDWVNDWNTASGNQDSSNTFNVTNDIDMQGHTLYAENNKTYIVNNSGDHIIQHVGIVNNNSGEASSNVIINSDVVGSQDVALTVIDGSVTVNGHVTTVDADDAITALDASGNANVTVNGDVGSAVAGGSKNPNIYAVQAGTGADVTISGDVFSAENGVKVILDASVTVQQDIDVNGTSVMATDNGTLTVGGNIEGGASYIVNSDVTVGGGFTANGTVYIDSSSLTMEDDSVLKAPQVHIYSGSDVDVGSIDASRVTVGITGGADDFSTLHSGTITNGSDNSKLEVGGNADVEVTGNVDNVIAKNNATVTVGGTAGSVTEKDNAEVTVTGSAPSTPPYTPFPDDPVCSEPDIDYQKKFPSIQGTLQPTNDVVTLCTEFKENTADNDMQKHLDSIDTIRMDLIEDLDKLNTVGNAIIAQTILTIDLDTHLIGNDLRSSSLDESLYHPDSIAEVKSHISYREADQRGYHRVVETLDIDKSIAYMYQDQLAASLEHASEVISSNAADSYNEANTTLAFSTALAILGLQKGPGYGLSPSTCNRDQVAEVIQPQLAKLSEEEQEQLLDDVERLLSVVSSVFDLKNMSTTELKIMEIVLTSVEFQKFWVTDYSCQIEVLDNLLKEQPMSVEMFYAAVDLRNKYENKIAAITEEIVNKAVSFGVGEGLGLIPGLKKAHAVLTIAANTNAAEKYRVLVEGISSSMVLSEAHDAYISAIKKIKNGDHSEDAVNMLYMTFSMYKTTMLNMCDAVIANGDRSQAAEYRNKKAHLERLQVGQLIPGT